MLTTLLGGQTLLASELARIAGVTPQTASAHLAKMVDGGLIISESHGRNRYFRLASSDVAHVLEALSLVAKPTKIRSLRQSEKIKALHYARTCYDHLAGEVGVAITSRMLELKWLIANGKDFIITDNGAAGLLSIGVDVSEIYTGRRAMARQCLDWSERRYHVAGLLGATITNRFFELSWIERKVDTRAITVTKVGSQALLKNFDIRVDALKIQNESM